jgi:hypothetical protein
MHLIHMLTTEFDGSDCMPVLAALRCNRSEAAVVTQVMLVGICTHRANANADIAANSDRLEYQHATSQHCST